MCGNPRLFESTPVTSLVKDDNNEHFATEKYIEVKVKPLQPKASMSNRVRELLVHCHLS